MERVRALQELREGHSELPAIGNLAKHFPHLATLILRLTSHDPKERPSAAELLVHPALQLYPPVHAFSLRGALAGRQDLSSPLSLRSTSSASAFDSTSSMFSSFSPPATPLADASHAVSFVRSYKRSVVRRVERLAKRDGYRVDVFGNVKIGGHSYALQRIVVLGDGFVEAAGAAASEVVLCAGVHGNAPASVHALLDFLEHEAHSERFRTLRLRAYVCLNPSGFEANTRVNLNAMDLDCLFGGCSLEPEVRLLEEDLRQGPARYRLALVLGESAPELDDLAPRGAVVWETRKSAASAPLAASLVDALTADCVPACDVERVYGQPCSGGVVSVVASAEEGAAASCSGLADFLIAHHTEHVLCLQTPCGHSLDARIETQCVWLRCALERVAGES